MERALFIRNGRYTILHPVLCRIVIYHLSFFKILVGQANKIEKMMRDLLWEGSDEGTNRTSGKLDGDVSC